MRAGASTDPEAALVAEISDDLLDRAAASAYLATIGVKRTPATLAKLACVGGSGPPFVHRGRSVFYPRKALREWGASQLTIIHRRRRAAEARA